MRSYFLIILALICSPAKAQLNMSIVGQLDYDELHGSSISDVWGYVDQNGTEYALVGVNGGGVSVVSLADPSDPVEVFWYPGPNSIWRDLKVWDRHAYITTEGGGGLAIIDLSTLPTNTDLNAQNWEGDGWSSAHNIFIDENGIAYICGADRGNGGIIFLDLTQDPFEPVEVGEFDLWYAHDCMARGDTLYGAHLGNGLSVVDVSNKQAPVLLGTQATGNNFTHNCWVSDDGQYVFTTDEVTGGWMGSYDISDPTDIQDLQLFRSDPGSNTIPHNTHFINEYIVTSYYRLGTTIHDVARPWNVVEVAQYDHSPMAGDGFNGGWGTYPWLPSGLIISTDIEQGLFVLEPTYVRACYLEGTVRDANSSAPVAMATVQIVDVAQADPTGFTGTYATGYHTAGTFTVMASAPGYESAMIPGVELENGVVTFLDIDLVPLVPFALQGSVIDAISGDPVVGAQVRLKSPTYEYLTQAGADGSFQIPAMFEDDYAVVAGQWGWRTVCPIEQPIDASTGILTIELTPGWYDDFVLDMGWTVTGNASSGAWERGAPAGTSFQGQASNPGSDVATDCGVLAYVTGNGGGSAGSDDVDEGSTTLLSPVFDATTMWDPHIRYHRWFFNAGGSGSPNDRLRVILDNGSATVVVENITSSASAWVPADIRILDHLPISTTMQISFFITDDEPGHLVEGGIDLFEVVEMSPVSVSDGSAIGAFEIWPNPSSGAVDIAFPFAQSATIEVLDVIGRRLRTASMVNTDRMHLDLDLPAGTYHLRWIGTEGQQQVRKLVLLDR